MKNRIFLVGCPRSGTTLLQTLIMSSTNISSFPETHFFCNLFNSKYNRFTKGFYAEKLISDWSENKNGQKRSKKLSLSVKSGIESFVSYFDALAKKEKNVGWLEKTPDHLRYVDNILKFIPDAKFIHILRPAKETIASFYEASSSWGEGTTIEKATLYWLESVRLSLQYLNNDKHLIVLYEDILENPDEVISAIGEFLEVPVKANGTKNLNKYAKKVVSKEESWKKLNLSSDSIDKSKANKFYTIFNDSEQNSILSILEQHDNYYRKLI